MIHFDVSIFQPWLVPPPPRIPLNPCKKMQVWNASKLDQNLCWGKKNIFPVQRLGNCAWGSRGYRMNQPFIWEMVGVSLGIFFAFVFINFLLWLLWLRNEGTAPFPATQAFITRRKKIPMTWQRLIRPAAGMPNVGREKWRWQLGHNAKISFE